MSIYIPPIEQGKEKKKRESAVEPQPARGAAISLDYPLSNDQKLQPTKPYAPLYLIILYLRAV